MGTVKNAAIEERTEKLLLPIMEQLSREPDENGDLKAFELVDVEYVKEGSNWYLRAYADKEGGISINDCERISRLLEAQLDSEDLIPDAYILEVSSPGLTRQLKKERDYLRNLNKPVEVHLYRPVEVESVNAKGKTVKEKIKIFIGDLKAFDDNKIVLDIGEEQEELFEIGRTEISLIKQYVVF